ncbi:conserved hypothetical protein [Stutzerimonas stutzeri A1501]|uniref:Uncharacterized protein n=1 Tax=Stutzerimonas stutzeri (strain A1501) TaxID=379731 RepID=A4VNR0_STUS1|nr:conserved hypothetical protein [Stutzerimonas stutzeri A1501]RRW03850.1 hypothetical protein EGJ30_16105 [Stutzerimonas stutzeri]RRW11989.1 hypothetical protein EGJ43_18930 [Stutzerimonas stutzeri]
MPLFALHALGGGIAPVSFLIPRFLDLDQSLRVPGIGILRPLTRVNFFPVARVYLEPIEQRIRFRR